MPESERNSRVSDDKGKIEELEKKLAVTEELLNTLENKLKNTQERFEEVMESKKLVQDQLTQLEAMKIDLKLQKYQELKINYNQINHQNQVIKDLINEARDRISFQNQVIDDLRNRGIIDLILRRYPESYSDYQKQDSINFGNKK